MLGPDAAGVAVARTAALLVQACSLFVLAHALGSHDFGVFALVLVVQSLIAVISNLGVLTAGQFHVGHGVLDVERVAAAGLAATAVGSVVLVPPAVFVLSWLYHSLLPDLPFDLFVLAVLAGPIRLGYEAMLGIFIGTGDVRGQSLTALAGPVLLILLLILAAFSIGISLEVAVLAWLTSQVATLGLALIQFRRHGHLLAPREVAADRDLWKRFLRVGKGAYVAYVVYWGTMRLDRIALNVVGGAEAVGVFALAAWVAESFALLPTAIGAVLFPRLAVGTLSAVSSYTSSATRATVGASAALAVPTVLALWLASSTLKSDILHQAVPVLAVILPGYVLFGLFGIYTSYWAAQGRVAMPALYFAAAAIGKVIVALALYQRFGVVGVAAGVSLVSGAIAVAGAAAVARQLRLPVSALLVPDPGDARRIATASLLIVSRLRTLGYRQL